MYIYLLSFNFQTYYVIESQIIGFEWVCIKYSTWYLVPHTSYIVHYTFYVIRYTLYGVRWMLYGACCVMMHARHLVVDSHQ